MKMSRGLGGLQGTDSRGECRSVSCSFAQVVRKAYELAGFVSRENISNVGSQGTDSRGECRSVSGATPIVVSQV